MYLAKILEENIKRYYQMKVMIKNIEGTHNLLNKVNSGLDGILGILITLPIKDQQILANLQQYQDALRKIELIYGTIPKSKEELLQKLHDQTVSESIKMISQVLSYTQQQEKNAEKLISRAQVASPKGAAQMTVEVNAAILHSLNQLIKINGQMLKVQSEALAMNNKAGKDDVKHLDKIKHDFNGSLKGISSDEEYKMPRFE